MEDQYLDHTGNTASRAAPAAAAGAVEGLKSLKQARLTDPVTGLTWGVVRVYADPSTTQQALPPTKRSQSPAPSAIAGKQQQQLSAGAVAAKPPAKLAEGKPGQVCVNCGKWCYRLGVRVDMNLLQGTPRLSSKGASQPWSGWKLIRG